MTSKKYFTLEEAENFIPHLQGRLKRLIQLKKAINLLNTIEIDFEDYHYEHNLLSLNLNKKYHKLSYDFYRYLELLEATGCVIKDLDLGLVDFYSRHQGRDILFCWKFGERAVKFWHEVDSGFTERKPVSSLKDESQRQKNPKR